MTYQRDVEMLAPSVHPEWREDFILELRLRGVPGALITDALAEVETHCRESGQSAATAFGPAEDYARALDLPDESGFTRAQLMRTWVTLLLLLAGIGASLSGAVALAQDQPVQISAGSLVTYSAIAVVMMVGLAFGDRLLRPILDHPVWFGLGFATAVAGVLIIGLPLRDRALGAVPAGATLAVGVAALVAYAGITLMRRRTGDRLDDPLIPPNSRKGTRGRR